MKLLMVILSLLVATCTAQVPQQPVSTPAGVELPAYGEDEDIVVRIGYTASYNH